MTIFDEKNSALKDFTTYDAQATEDLRLKLISEYDQKKSGIDEIKNTQGFKVILEYFEKQKFNCEAYFQNGLDDKILPRVQGRYDLVCRFIAFLDNLKK